MSQYAPVPNKLAEEIIFRRKQEQAAKK
jgi:hypothetical protein